MTPTKLPFTVDEYAFALGIDAGLEGFENEFEGTLSPDGTFTMSQEKNKRLKALTLTVSLPALRFPTGLKIWVTDISVYH